MGDSDALHAAACHVCLFLSETSCERGNRFLDRRLLVPVGEDPSLAYWHWRTGTGVLDRMTDQEVQLVWTGPSSAAVPVRSMAAVLEDLITEATSELVIMTYSARPYEPVRVALAAALQRGVRVDVVVETLAGAGSALSGSEPAAAFAGLPGLTLWHWPKSSRSTESAKMHAKVAITDGHSMLVSSANLTQSGVHDSLEAGVLVRGGTAPQRALEYIRDLQVRSLVVPLR